MSFRATCKDNRFFIYQFHATRMTGYISVLIRAEIRDYPRSIGFQYIQKENSTRINADPACVGKRG